jgi:choline/glycine/proline betaine transport protein
VDLEGSLENIFQLRDTVSLHFTWLFTGSKAICFFFMLWIWYRYGHIKLGHQHDVPEFTTPTYFCIIFATGVASGFFVFAVAEPLWHQHGLSIYKGYHTQDELSMFAINMTVNNWGISGWTGYAIVAVCMSLATHRFKLPMTVRSCFYPILRDYTWGWIGDCIDGLTIVVSVAGLCTSLGLGAVEIVSGLIYLDWVDEYSRQDYITGIETTSVWVITVICTASAISGVHGGIRLLSIVAICAGLLLLCFVFFLDDSKFLLNLIVQEFGYYLQTSVFLLNFWTDAFGQLRQGPESSVDGAAAQTPWMEETWLLFYQAWWSVISASMYLHFLPLIAFL